MWGLDAADPRVAVAAMQAMNASVRNAAFAPAFSGTAPAPWLAAAALWACYSPRWQTLNQLRTLACGAAVGGGRVAPPRPPGGLSAQPAAMRLCLRATKALAVSTATAASRQ